MGSSASNGDISKRSYASAIARVTIVLPGFPHRRRIRSSSSFQARSRLGRGWDTKAIRIARTMRILADVALAVVALLHLGFLVLEMFLWTKPFGLRTFRLTPEIAQASAGLAANQGLYNGFLAAGLIW